MKRVPLDFDAPLGETWEGYTNPHYKPCHRCSGDSREPALQYLEAVVEMLMLGGSHPERGHPWMAGLPFWEKPQGPGRLYRELSCALAGRDIGGPHDVCDKFGAVRKILDAAGLDIKWGHCSACKGTGIDESAKADYDAWEDYEPPEGDGWQMWSTTNDGPMSPVCEAPEALAHWLASTGASSFGYDTATYDEWMNLIRAGWAPSMIADANGIKAGAKAAPEK